MLPTLTALLLLAFAPAAAPTEQPESDCVESADGLTVTCSRPDSITASTDETETLLKWADPQPLAPPLATVGSDDEGRFRGPFIVISPKWKACDLAEFAKAARAIGPYLGITDEEQWEWVDSECPLEADDFRICFDQQERLRSDAIRAFRAQLDKCGWMAEPGAFDRK